MKKTRIKTYLTVPVFLGMLLVTGRVAADEVEAAAKLESSSSATVSAVPTTVTAETNPVPPQGTYTFTETTGVKAEPIQASPDLDFYQPGEQAHYDKTVENDDRLWISYNSNSGKRSYVAVRDLPDNPKTAPVSSPAATDPETLPDQGRYKFTEKTPVKAEPKLSSPDRAFYDVGETVNYDKKLEADDHLWLSYVNYSGGRSYVAVKKLKPAAPDPVSQPLAPVVAPAATPSSTPSVSASLPSRGTYTFTTKTGVKSEPKFSAKNHDFYTPGEKVNYDKTLEADSHLWLSYINYSGGRSYVAVKELKPETPAPTSVSQPTSSTPAPSATPTTTGSISNSLPSRGTYTFTAKIGVKSEPKISAPDRAHYTVGEKVNYDKTLEQDNHLWLSYVNYSGGRSYVAVKELKPAAPAPVSQPSAPAPVVAPSSSSSASTSLPARGTYTFTAKTGIKSEPKISAPDRAHYTAGEKVNYDKTLEQDNHLWLSYVNYSGGRSYVAVKELKPVAPVVVPISTETDRPIAQPSRPSIQPSTPTQPEIPVEQPTVPASTESPVFESTSSEASVGQTDSPTVTAQSEIPAEKPTVTEQISSPVQPTHPVVPAPKPVQTSPAFPSRGVYTFTEKTGVKSQPRLISPDRDYYYPGEKVNYDKTIEQDNHLWLSYTNFSGGRSYVAVKALSPVVEDKSDLKSEATKKYNAKAAVTDYQVNKPTFTVEVTGQTDTKSISHVRVAVWSEDKGQDDLKWYEPKIENNQAQVTVDIANHSNTAGTYRVHVYTTYADQTTAGVDLGAYQINQPVGKGASASQGNYDVLTKTIYLDAGHGGSDPGAVYFGKTEKELNLAIQESLMTRLMKAGYEVVLTRSVDNFVDLIDRSKRANNSLADLFLSIHFNAAPNSEAKGIETYYYKYNAYYPPRINGDYHVNEERLNRSKFLAEAIHKETVANTGAYDNGVRRETFSVLRETTAPAVLVELGYMSNQAEMANIRQASYQEKLVDGIFNGIQAYYRRFT